MTTAPVTTKTEMSALTGIRAYLVLMVLANHLSPLTFAMFPRTQGYERVFWSANGAVDTFFALSGFVLTYTYLERFRRPSVVTVRDYAVARFARIYPVFIVSLVLWVVYVLTITRSLGDLLNSERFRPLNLLMNGLLLNAIPPATSINSPSWSVSLETIAYVFLPLLLIALTRVKRASWAFVSAGVLVLCGALLMHRFNADTMNSVVYQTPWIRVGYALPAGCLLACGWLLLPPRLKSGVHWDVVGIGSVAAIAAITASSPQKLIVYYPVATMPFLVLLVIAAAGSTGWFKALLSVRPAMFVGTVSYSLYLIHYLVLIIIFRWASAHDVSGWSTAVQLLILVGSVCIVFVATLTLYYLVERPSRRWIRRRWGIR
jgi:peptidoglycan/LPS O-acetylase OafA/YrhL